MSLPILILFCTLVVGGAVAAILYLGFYLYQKYVVPVRTKRDLLDTRFEFQELVTAIDTIIAVETLIYERYLENTTDISMTTITNSQFINIYKDLSARILKGISPQMYECGSVYMTKEEMQTYVTQRVYNYMAEKVKPGNDTREIVI